LLLSKITSRHGHVRSVLLILFLVLLTACSVATGEAPQAPGEGTASSQEEGDASAGPAPAEPAPAEPAPATQGLAPTRPQATRADPAAPPALLLVTTETGAGLEFVRKLAAEFNERSTWRVEVVAKAPAELRVDLRMAALAEAVPDIIWAQADDARVLAAAELIQPVPDLFEPDDFVPAAVADANLQGEQWGVPVSGGDQLVVLYNRGAIASPPGTTDELLAMQRPDGMEAVLAYDTRDPLWLSAWLQGFGGSLRGDDGRPALNSPQMLQTFFFLKELGSRGVVPSGVDAATAEALFREGKAAMLATHAWALASFAGQGAPPFEVGIAPLPKAASTGRSPAAGLPSAQLLVGKGVEGERRAAAEEFAAYVTGTSVQERLVSEARRLPALLSVLQGQAMQSDPVLQPLAAAQQDVVPLQAQDSLLNVVGPRLAQVLAGERPPEEAVEEMQEAATGASGG
jgi:arabinogalactan oligomer/maltooligosaccharide transport system substrate-binding protein